MEPGTSASAGILFISCIAVAVLVAEILIAAPLVMRLFGLHLLIGPRVEIPLGQEIEFPPQCILCQQQATRRVDFTVSELKLPVTIPGETTGNSQIRGVPYCEQHAPQAGNAKERHAEQLSERVRQHPVAAVFVGICTIAGGIIGLAGSSPIGIVVGAGVCLIVPTGLLTGLFIGTIAGAMIAQLVAGIPFLFVPTRTPGIEAKVYEIKGNKTAHIRFKRRDYMHLFAAANHVGITRGPKNAR